MDLVATLAVILTTAVPPGKPQQWPKGWGPFRHPMILVDGKRLEKIQPLTVNPAVKLGASNSDVTFHLFPTQVLGRQKVRRAIQVFNHTDVAIAIKAIDQPSSACKVSVFPKGSKPTGGWYLYPQPDHLRARDSTHLLVELEFGSEEGPWEHEFTIVSTVGKHRVKITGAYYESRRSMRAAKGQ